MTAALRQVIEKVKALSTDERNELKDLMRDMPDLPVSGTGEQALARRLATEGRLTLPTGNPASVTPVPATGKPLSEMIIEERR